LTQTWTEHQVALDDPQYSGDSGLIGAFMFSMVAPENAATTVFYLDDIRWLP
jgi:hypothetical protein